MELTLEQALQKGVEAHKAGQAQEADKYYTAILKANPKHPDANHNMGVLAVGVGKVEVALPFFKTALEVNQTIGQYWLSYINALIKLDRLDDAKAVLNQAKSKGIKGDAFDKLKQQLDGVEKDTGVDAASKKPKEPLQKQVQSLIDLHTQGQYQDALTQSLKLLEQFPSSINLYNIIGAANQSLGKLDKAIETYTKALSIKPHYADAYYNMGIVLKEQSKLEEAVEAYNKALSIKPDYADAYNNMGIALKDQGKLDEAIEAFTKAVSIKPDNDDAYYNMGNTFQDQGKLEEAIVAYTKAISIKPDNAEAYNNMGIVLQKQGKLEEALEAYDKAILIKLDLAEAYYNMGNAFKDQGKLEKAIETYTKALSIKPHYADAYYNMGNAFKERGKLVEAIEAYDKALSIKPHYADAYYNMGNAFKERGKLVEAIEAYNKALSIRPHYADAYHNMGIVLQEQGKLEEAIEAYNKAISIKPDFANAYFNMGNALRDQGKLEKVLEAYNKAIIIKPDFAEAHRNISAIKKYAEDDDQIVQVQELYKQEDRSEEAKCHLSFALAKMYEDIGDLNQAFTHLAEGNALRRKLLTYSINQDKNLFSDLKKVQPKVLKNSLKVRETSTDITPIFILGMPRSGTTLIEQIISSHSEVTGAGELNYAYQLGIELAISSKLVNPETISEFQKKYLSEVLKLSNGKHFVTDKMPHNFRFIPLICAAFPKAKIIHVKRNAAATCWSNFKQYFTSKNLGYCYSLKDVVSYYELYKDLMKLWQSHYGDRIYNLNYEKLTTDQENQTRKLINHLGLNWEQACLSPQKNKRSVRTASQQQVKQKVYKGSSEAWRKYEPYLNGAFDSLSSS